MIRTKGKEGRKEDRKKERKKERNHLTAAMQLKVRSDATFQLEQHKQPECPKIDQFSPPPQPSLYLVSHHVI
jgi:hypothetical protein